MAAPPPLGKLPTESDAWNRHSYMDPKLNERRLNHQGLCNVMYELGMLAGVPPEQIRAHVDREFAQADTLKDGTLIDHHEFTVWFNGALQRRSQAQAQQPPAYGVPAYPPPQQQYAPPPAGYGAPPPQPYYPPPQPQYAPPQPQYAPPPQPYYAPPPQPVYAQPHYAPQPQYVPAPMYAQPQYVAAPMGGYGYGGGYGGGGMSTGMAVGAGVLGGLLLEDLLFD